MRSELGKFQTGVVVVVVRLNKIRERQKPVDNSRHRVGKSQKPGRAWQSVPLGSAV